MCACIQAFQNKMYFIINTIFQVSNTYKTPVKYFSRKYVNYYITKSLPLCI